MSAEVVPLDEAVVPKSKLSLGWEPLAALLLDPDFAGMIRAQHREMGHLKDVMPLCVDWAKLLETERIGGLRVWSARVSGALAGFIAFMMHVHPFHLGVARAFADVSYVSPRFRGKGLLYRRMWDGVLADMKVAGVKVALAHDNVIRPQDRFYEGLGFEPAGTVFMKAL